MEEWGIEWAVSGVLNGQWAVVGDAVRWLQPPEMAPGVNGTSLWVRQRNAADMRLHSSASHSPHPSPTHRALAHHSPPHTLSSLTHHRTLSHRTRPPVIPSYRCHPPANAIPACSTKGATLSCRLSGAFRSSTNRIRSHFIQRVVYLQIWWKLRSSLIGIPKGENCGRSASQSSHAHKRNRSSVQSTGYISRDLDTLRLSQPPQARLQIVNGSITIHLRSPWHHSHRAFPAHDVSRRPPIRALRTSLH